MSFQGVASAAPVKGKQPKHWVSLLVDVGTVDFADGCFARAQNLPAPQSAGKTRGRRPGAGAKAEAASSQKPKVLRGRSVRKASAKSRKARRASGHAESSAAGTAETSKKHVKARVAPKAKGKMCKKDRRSAKARAVARQA